MIWYLLVIMGNLVRLFTEALNKTFFVITLLVLLLLSRKENGVLEKK